MEIIHYPHPALRWKSKPITRIDTRLKSIVQEMFELMYAAKGIGLAANQIALPYRLFVINPSGDPHVTEEEFVFINPVLSHRRGSELAEEGCLSLPLVYGDVRRPSQIRVQAYNLSGEAFEFELNDIASRVVQHENDHLDGILFIDKVADSVRKDISSQIDNFEETFRAQQASNIYPSDEEILRQLREKESDFTS